jgi:hypothetical protein
MFTRVEGKLLVVPALRPKMTKMVERALRVVQKIFPVLLGEVGTLVCVHTVVEVLLVVNRELPLLAIILDVTNLEFFGEFFFQDILSQNF